MISIICLKNNLPKWPPFWCAASQWTTASILIPMLRMGVTVVSSLVFLLCCLWVHGLEWYRFANSGLVYYRDNKAFCNIFCNPLKSFHISTGYSNYNEGWKCWTAQVNLSEISLLPIFNVDPHYTVGDAIVEHNIETRGGKGEFHSQTKSLG